MTHPHRALSRLAATIGALLTLAAMTACAQSGSPPASQAATANAPGEPAVAIFGGGCFWCMEPPFDKLPGVLATTSGYIGGHVANPTYERVSRGGTGHVEVVQVQYDPALVSYPELLKVFWRNIDPVAVDRQFCDAGDMYRSAIFAVGANQQRMAEASKRSLQDSGVFDRPIATEIIAAPTFYPAENYHQDYYTKNPVRYRLYRYNCGRDMRLEELWGRQDS